MAQRASALNVADAAISRYYELALVGMLASGYGAILSSGAMDAPSAILAGLALIARLALVSGSLRFQVPPLWINILTLAYIGFYPLDWRFVSKDFLTATVHLVFFVAAVKLLTAVTPRDYLLLKVIALMEVLAAAILSADLKFLLFLMLFMVSSVAALSAGEIRASARSSRVVPAGSKGLGRRLSALTAVSVTAVIVLTGLFFFVLPRTARAALSWINPSQSRVSGFGNEVVLGQSGEIQRSNAAVMHYRFKDGVRPAGLRWRATALSEFDGWKWYNTAQPARALMPGNDGLLKLADDNQLRREGQRLSYRVVLHGLSTDWLFVTGMPEYLRLRPTRVLMTPSGGLRVPFTQPDGFSYDVIAWPGEASPAAISAEQRVHHLRLPAPDPRVLKLANEITANSRNDMERAQALERWLQTQLKYSLDPWERVVDDPLAYFLFERKKGHCEYFASAMAVMLRAVWIPSRVVTGFLGGAPNPLMEWQVVRGSNAHSWVEAWIPGQGWTTFDPTPAAPGGEDGISRVSMWLEAVEMFWQEWVVGYDLDRQLTLALSVNEGRRRVSFAWASRWWSQVKAAGEELTRGTSSVPWLGGLGVLIAAGVALPFLFRRAEQVARRRRAARGELSSHDASVFYGQMLESLERRGLVKLGGQTPEEFARSIPDSSIEPVVSEFTRAYYSARYGAASAGATRLAPLLDKIKSLP